MTDFCKSFFSSRHSKGFRPTRHPDDAQSKVSSRSAGVPKKSSANPRVPEGKVVDSRVGRVGVAGGGRRGVGAGNAGGGGGGGGGKGGRRVAGKEKVLLFRWYIDGTPISNCVAIVASSVACLTT